MSLSVTIIGADGKSTVQTFDGDRLSIQGITLKVESDPSSSPPVVIPPPIIVPIPFTITTVTGQVTSPFTIKGTGPIGSTVQLTDVFTAPVIVIPPVPIPSTPTGLAGTASLAGVTLSWNSVIGATSYNVYRSGLNLNSVSSNSFNDITTLAGTTYSYGISAVNSAGESGQTTISVTTPAIVVVTNPSTITQPVGTWLNITPSTIIEDPNFGVVGSNYGVENLEVDPVRPSDFYITADYQGVWKSKDYGQTWSKVNTGTNGALLDAARPSLLVIDPNKNRDPLTPPTLYTTDLYGAVPGLYKSVDGGVNFTKLPLPSFADGLLNGQDPYALDIDPYDNKHFILSFHGTSELAESIDGGSTWKVLNTLPALIGTSLGIFFVDTGIAGTTRGNWVSLSQWGNNTNGTWHTADSGATWKQVGTFEHFHGADQLFNAGNGVAYISATGGVYKTVNGGATFTNINGGNGNGVVATPTHLYTTFGWATNGTWDPQMASALRTADTKWTAIPTPTGMTNGSKHGIVTSDGTHTYVITVNGNAGIWRFVES